MPEITLQDTLTSIGNRIDAAFERTKCGRQEWIDGSLDLAAALLDGRNQFPSNATFGVWLRDSHHDHVSHQNRAALIKFGRDLSSARTVFEATTNTDYEYIWQREGARLTEVRNTDTTSNRAERSNIVSTGRGPWTNAIDDRLIALRGRGSTDKAMARILSSEFAVEITKDMCVNARRRLGLVERPAPRPSSRSARSTSSRPPVTNRDEISISNRPSIRPMTREQVDPDWDRPDAEWVMRHGHVHAMTAERKASQMFDTVTDELRAAAQKIREMQPQTSRAMMDDYWLRRLCNPRERSIARLTEALEYLRPRIAEAEAALARAVEVARQRQAAP